MNLRARHPSRSLRRLGFSLLTLALGLLVGCYRVPTPDSLIDRDKMVDILTDIHLTQAAVDITVPDTGGYFLLRDTAMAVLLKTHQIRKSQLDSSMNFYLKDLEIAEAMYSEVIERLNELETMSVQERSR
jgi:hypothetical protein